MFQNMRLIILFDMFLNSSFKMTSSFVNIAGTTASASEFNTKKDFKSSLNFFNCHVAAFFEAITLQEVCILYFISTITIQCSCQYSKIKLLYIMLLKFV